MGPWVWGCRSKVSGSAALSATKDIHLKQAALFTGLTSTAAELASLKTGFGSLRSDVGSLR